MLKRAEETMNIRISALIVFVTMILAGCSTTKQVVRFPDQSRIVEEQGKGRIYVIGNPLFMNIASNTTKLSVVADQEWVGDIVGNSYLCWEREPGFVTIVARPIKSDSLKFMVESGKVYYISAHVAPGWTPVNLVNPASGELIIKLKQVDEIKGKELLSKSKPPDDRHLTR